MPAKSKQTASADTSDREIVSSRVFDAPRELVFKMWTEPEHLAQWWGPKGFTNTFHEFDLRPGGHWRFIMHGPDGTDYKNQIVFVEIVKPERLVYSHVSGPKYQGTATFTDLGDKTKLTVSMLFESATECDKVKPFVGAGNEQNFDRLETHLARQNLADREIVLTRVINAPRELVFDAYTDREHVDQWWGPNGFRNETVKMDVRPGGMWRFIMHAPNGTDFGNRIIYREVVQPERLVFDHGADMDDDPNQFHVTVTFDAQGGKTLLTQRMLFKTAEQRAQAAGFGAVELGNQTLGKFEAFVMSMAAQAAK